jgi:hypothetical protein
LFVGDHVEKVASFPKEDLAKSGYEPDMKFKFKKAFFHIFGYTLKTNYINMALFFYGSFPSLLAIENPPKSLKFRI